MIIWENFQESFKLKIGNLFKLEIIVKILIFTEVISIWNKNPVFKNNLDSFLFLYKLCFMSSFFSEIMEF